MNNYLYFWQGINQNNILVKGELRAVSKNHLSYILQQQNIRLIKSQKKIIFFRKVLFSKKINQQDIAYFFHQLATLHSSGIALSQCLDILSRNKKNSFKDLVYNLQQHILSGYSLKCSLQQYSSYFDSLTLNLVAIGEQTGKIDLVLLKTADYLEKKIKLAKKLNQILFYPTFVIVIASMVISIMLFFIVPKFEDLYFHLDHHLPLLTRAILFLSKFFRNYFYLILSFFCLFLYLIINVYRKIKISPKFLPKSIFLEQIFFQLQISFAAGIPLSEIFQIFLNLDPHIFFKKKFSIISKKLLSGENFHHALQDNYFPDYVVELIKIGEESGKLETMLKKIHELCQEELDNLLLKFSQVAEPLIMIVVGVLIGVLVIAIYLPIFELGTVM